MSLYTSYKTDKTAEANGVWYEDSGARFKLARMGGANTRYQRALTSAMKPHMREIQLGVLDESTIEPIAKRVFLDTILLDWENVTVPDASGDENAPEVSLAFNRDNATKLFEDLPDLYARLRDQAGSYANYRAATLQDASKN